jgi:ribose transport system ATP-binding protein
VPINDFRAAADVAHQQMLEIAIALSKKAQVIVMDEPTAALSKRETEVLFRLIDQLKGSGLGIVYVSHKLEEIKAIGDQITILRDGNNVATLDAKSAQLNEIIRLMVGTSRAMEPRESALPKERILFSVKRLQNKHFSTPIDLTVRENEILCITGLVGAGKTELTRVLFGADPKTGDEIWFADSALKLHRPRDAMKIGVGYVPEDRDRKGLCLSLAVSDNLGLATLAKLKGWSFDRVAQRKAALYAVTSMRIRAQGLSQPVKYLAAANHLPRTKVKVVTFDPEVLPLFESGVIDCIIAQDPYQMGYQGVDAVDKARNEVAIEKKKVELAPVVITPENYKTPEVQKLLQTPEKFQ